MRFNASHERSGFDQLSYVHIVDRCGAPDRTRTCNRRLRRPMLYPVELRALSFVGAPIVQPIRLPRRERCMNLVGVEGLELSTSSSQSWRSTRLSYTPIVRKFFRLACRTVNLSMTSSAGRPSCADEKKGAEAPFANWRARRDSNSRPPSS
jgi:hypothetical protein